MSARELSRPRGDAAAPAATAGTAGVVDAGRPRAICVAILAMGGEGGGVLADWVVDLGESNGFVAQATSVPGVAQRTGATIYYVELFPEAAVRAAGREPVLALMPTPGEVDVVIASELMEAGRAIQRGLVSDDRTTLIASTNRVYSMTEKTAMADGRVDSSALLGAGRDAARRFVAADFARLAEDARSVISASLFGALAGTGALPFPREAFEAAVRRGGVGVDASLAAFAAGFDAAREAAAAPLPAPGDAVSTGATSVADGPSGSAALPGGPGAAAPARRPTVLGPRLRAHEARIVADFPAEAHEVLRAGVLRLADWQDEAHAADYLDRLGPLRALDARGGGAIAGEPPHALLAETARHLALWMSYEDTVRVADLKTRRSRFERVAGEVRLADGQLLEIGEFLHPRVEEIADTLPAALGRRLLAGPRLRGWATRLAGGGRVVRTSSVRGFLTLYAVASLRRIRRSSLRFQVETARIGDWLARVVAVAGRDPALALEIARCQTLVRGYSDTHARGWANFERLMQAVDRLPPGALSAAGLRGLREAALADEGGVALGAALARLEGGGAVPPAAHAA
ncbi:MAG TPA: indolepyruvate oxidoreductase subunit beta family protein [Burkholderiaceae bacterium]|nr:indolepyruvate oxidoreductase subunit beta family protein [Burkholderiaceae bacterium]